MHLVTRLMQIRRQWQGMHQVAKGAETDDQDTHGTGW